MRFALRGMKTSHPAKGVHSLSESMGQGGLVSIALPDLVPDVSRLLRHSRHCSSGIHLCLGSDGYPLTTCGHDEWGIRFTPAVAPCLSGDGCRWPHPAYSASPGARVVMMRGSSGNRLSPAWHSGNNRMKGRIYLGRRGRLVDVLAGENFCLLLEITGSMIAPQLTQRHPDARRPVAS